MFFEIKMDDVIKFIENSRKCNKGDCTCYKKFKFKFKFSIELFGAITGEFILENREDFTYKCFCCRTINTISSKKICDRGMMNVIYKKIMNKNMGIKESRNVYVT